MWRVVAPMSQITKEYTVVDRGWMVWLFVLDHGETTGHTFHNVRSAVRAVTTDAGISFY
jgi:hypothetical protein